MTAQRDRKDGVARTAGPRTTGKRTRQPAVFRVRAVLVLAVLTFGIRVMFAHHSYAAIDLSKRATISGTVLSLEWTNPHVWLWIAAPDHTGASVRYAFEAVSPAELTRFFGWTKRALTPG
jgi:hypothetical protein